MKKTLFVELEEAIAAYVEASNHAYWMEDQGWGKELNEAIDEQNDAEKVLDTVMQRVRKRLSSVKQ